MNKIIENNNNIVKEELNNEKKTKKQKERQKNFQENSRSNESSEHLQSKRRSSTIEEILKKEPLYQIISVIIFKDETKKDYLTTLVLLSEIGSVEKKLKEQIINYLKEGVKEGILPKKFYLKADIKGFVKFSGDIETLNLKDINIYDKEIEIRI